MSAKCDLVRTTRQGRKIESDFKRTDLISDVGVAARRRLRHRARIPEFYFVWAPALRRCLLTVTSAIVRTIATRAGGGPARRDHTSLGRCTLQRQRSPRFNAHS